MQLPDDETLDRLKLSPEVAWYLASRGYELPNCPPKIKTPEPRDVEGAFFDAARVDKVVRSFALLRHTQGKWAGRPLILRPWQVAYLIGPTYGWVREDEDGVPRRIIRTQYLDIPRKNAKALDVQTPILTEAGWSTMGALEVGDRVYAPDGTPTAIVAASEVFSGHDCYRVTFSDGQEIVADAGHLWTVTDRNSYKGPRTVTTEWLSTRYLLGSRPTHQERRFSVPPTAPLQRPEAALPLEPYLLGLWLGDGETAGARMTTVDPEVLQAFVVAGYVLGARNGITTNVLGLLTQLRALGVLGNKHAPERYLLGSADQRRELLAGLMDSDGTVQRGSGIPRCSFTSTLRVLADAVLFLARSLGWKATVREVRTSLNGRDCGPAWVVAWNAYADEAPFRLERKACRLLPRGATPARSRSIQIVGIVPVPSRPTRCIQVDHPSSLYLAGRGLITTHNTTTGGGQCTYLTAADGEPGGQVFALATRKDQARFAFDPVRRICLQAPALRSNVKVLRDKITHPASGSTFSVLASAADGLHGASPSGAFIDELHLHKDRELVEAVESGTGARSQPLVIFATTADEGRPETIYAEKRSYCEKLADGVLVDPSFFGVVFAADEDDDPFSPATWRKANPGYAAGDSPTHQFLVDTAKKAQNDPANLASFQRLHLGIRTKQATRYVTLAAWDANLSVVDESGMADRTAFGGMDLGNVSDLSALVWLLPSAHGFDVLWRFWIAGDAVRDLDRRTGGAIGRWIKAGHIVETPGPTTDYDAILLKARADRELLDVREIGFDPWNASDLTKKLDDEGAPMVAVRQGYPSLSPALKECKRLLLNGTPESPLLRHGGNPVARWMTDNLAVATDASGNVKPDKASSSEKIDGWSAMTTAMTRAMAAAVVRRSAYADDQGVVVM